MLTNNIPALHLPGNKQTVKSSLEKMWTKMQINWQIIMEHENPIKPRGKQYFLEHPEWYAISASFQKIKKALRILVKQSD